MSELTCTCPHCGQDLNVGSEFSGQAVACPTCSGEFTVPDAPAAAPPNAPALQAPALSAGAPKLNAPATSGAAAPPPLHGGGPKLQAPGVAPGMAPPPPPGAPPANPYNSPASNVSGPQNFGGGAAVAPSTIQLFGATKGWVLFFAILGFLVAGLALVVGLMALSAGGSAGAIVALIYILIGGIYFLPAFKLLQYSSAIANLRISPTVHTLDTAVERQRSFWKTMGIITICAIILYIVAIIIVINQASSMMNSNYYNF